MKTPKHLAVLLAAYLVPGATGGLAPPGWSYQVDKSIDFGVTTNQAHTGKRSLYVKFNKKDSTELKNGLHCLYSSSRPDEIVFRSLVMVAEPAYQLRLFVSYFQFDPAESRHKKVMHESSQITKHGHWQQLEVRCKIPVGVKNVVWGVKSTGGTKVWLDDMEVVSLISAKAFKLKNPGFEMWNGYDRSWISNLIMDARLLSQHDPTKSMCQFNLILQEFNGMIANDHKEQIHQEISRIQKLQGNYSDAIAAIEKELNELKPSSNWQDGPIRGPNYALARLGDIVDLEWKMGRMGRAQQRIQQMQSLALLLEGNLDKEIGSPDARRLRRTELYGPWRYELQSFRFQVVSGQTQQALLRGGALIKEMKTAVKEARVGHINMPVVYQTLVQMTDVLSDLQHTEELHAILQTVKDFRPGRFRSAKAMEKLLLFRRTIYTQRPEAPLSEKDARSWVEQIALHESRYVTMLAWEDFAGFLLSGGDTDQAVSAIHQALDIANELGARERIPMLLNLNAEILLELNLISEAGEKLREALRLTRLMGNKYQEPFIYYNYSRALHASGQEAEAFKTIRFAQRMAGWYEMYNLGLRCQTWMVKAALNLGDTALAEQLWHEGLLYRDAHSSISPDLFKTHELLRSLLDNSVNKKAIVGRDNAPSLPNGHDQDVDFQPEITVTQVLAGNNAHGRFFLANPSDMEQFGTLNIQYGSFAGEWRISGDAIILEETENSMTGLPLTLAPGQIIPVDLLTPVVKLGEQFDVTVVWSQNTETKALWKISALEQAGVQSVKNSSFIADNPFAPVPFFHKIVNHDAHRSIIDIKVVTSLPCRVEIVDDLTSTIIGVDSIGNGSFSDPGDTIVSDKNMDLFPDVSFAPDQVESPLELWVFPIDGQTTLEADIIVAVYIKRDTEWELRAHNILGRQE